MFFSIRNKVNKKWFDWCLRGIYSTSKVQCDPKSHVIILSQIYHPDLTMFMVAAKSFCRYVLPSQFVIVDDGLTESDREILKHHFEPIKFVSSRTVGESSCPVGGCWERILSIADINQEHYVIQLDADTVTTSSPVEVIESVRQNRCFVLGTPGGREVISREEMSRIAAQWSSKTHVQVVAEQALSKLPVALGLNYVRGCAGFTGFSPGSISRQNIIDFSGAMSELVGKDKWSEWGSEQVTSNFLVANQPETCVLPVEKYPFWTKGVNPDIACLIHFFGTHRFEHGQYVKSARKIVRYCQKP